MSIPRAPLPHMYKRSWLEAQSPNPATDTIDTYFARVLQATTKYYDGPGRKPPSNYQKERARIL
jgi:hypothetical protein